MATIQGPKFGIIGTPAGVKNKGGAELLDDKLIVAIEQHGARLVWSRAAMCPCASVDPQIKSADPTCAKCGGKGVFYFGPEDYVPSAEAGSLTSLQEQIVTTSGGAVIHGVIQRVTQAQDLYDVLGNWVRGTMMVSVRPENKIGYYDRLVNIDSEIPYSQVVVATGATTLALRYPATGVNTLETLTTRYTQGEHFHLVNGRISWLGASAAAGTRLSVHYLINPTWLVIDHPHVLRETQRRRKQGGALVGTPTALPIQGAVRLEFLQESAST